MRWIAHRGETEHDTKGMAIRHFGVAIDVTTGKTAADAIQRSEARLNAVLAHLREGVIILTLLRHFLSTGHIGTRIRMNVPQLGHSWGAASC